MSDRAAALAWVEHLRAGGTDTWTTWRSASGRSGPEATPGAVPAAQQLELLRRLNVVGEPDLDLIDRVLAATPHGRGQPELDLAGATAHPGFGREPVDPTDLPDHELVRVAAGLIAETLVAEPVPPEPMAPRRPLWQRMSRRPLPAPYRLAGDPWQATFARDELVVRGRPPGRDAGQPRAFVVLLARDLPGMLADAWTFRAARDGVESWPRWLRLAQKRGPLPPRADLAAAARTWAGRVGAENVHVVLDPSALSDLLGIDSAPAPPPQLSMAAAELSRRVNPAVALLAESDRRRALLRRVLAPRLAALDDGAPPTVPADLTSWIADHAARQMGQIATGGYSVHGDRGALATRSAPARHDPATAEVVLDVALRYLLGRPVPRDEERTA